jgi:serine/threonine protein kinase
MMQVRGGSVAAAFETSHSPQIVGRYVLYGAIAAGGMATVHYGRLVGPAGFARPVAIKRLHAQFARDPEFVEMFLDEARLAARIAHPNVVQTLDLVQAVDEIFLVMDYVRGPALSSLVRILRTRKERMPPTIAVGIVVGVLEGLHAAHEATDDMGERLDLVHRDVSPQNILVGTDGVARLLDFGVAKAAGRAQSTRDGHVKGKIAYMAPEQILGQALTRRTDIFAASVLLWELLTGRRLFYGDSDAESFRRVLHEDVPPPSAFVPELAPALCAVTMRGLERNASKRYATAHDMGVALAACLAPSPPAQIGEWIERTASDELGERASRIAAIERSAAESMSRLMTVASVPSVGPPDAPVPIGPQRLDAANGDWRPAPPPAANGELPQIVPPRGPRSSPWLRLLLAIAAAVLGVATVATLGGMARRAPSPAPGPPAAPAAGPGFATAMMAPPAPSQTAPAAAADSGTYRDAVPSSKPPPARWPSGMTPAGGAPSPRGAPSASARSAVSPGCDPPYTEDGQGHVHFKPSCM